MIDPREEMIRLQKEWVKDLKRRIFAAEVRRDQVLDRYYDEYREHFQQGFERAATRAELVRQLAHSEIAWFGDFHTLKVAQKTIATLLEDVVEDYDRPLVLGLEMFQTRHQQHVDEYLAGKITEDELLRLCEYDTTWGFPFAHYRPLLVLAKDHKFPVLALNTSPKDPSRSLMMRDRAASRMVAAASVAHPSALVAVVFGDLHVGESHLPKATRHELKVMGVRRREVVVYQNSETFYWQLVAQRREHLVDAVKVRRGVYCVMSATPLVKFQSWVNWQETGGELDWDGIGAPHRAGESQAGLEEQFARIVMAIAQYIGLDQSGLDNFELYSTGDLDFMAELKRTRKYSKEELDIFTRIIREQKSAFFARARTVYLGSLSLNDAASMATQFIRYNCAPESFEEPRSERDAFYNSVLDEALSTVGVLIINPRYRVPQPSDLERQLADLRGRRKRDPESRAKREAWELVVDHEGMVVRFLDETWTRNSLRRIYALPSSLFRHVTTLIGRQLGAELYARIQAGQIGPGVLRDLFMEDRETGEPWERYIGLRRLLSLLPNAQKREMRASL